MKEILILTSAVLVSLATSSNSKAQVIPDNSLDQEKSTVNQNINVNNIPSILIQGGASRGSSLFHSFKEFSIPVGQGAYFSNPSGITTIFTRVTGGKVTNIGGRLGILGNADLFLMNPSGILFGPQSTLDVNGSLLLTTASSLQFSDSFIFNSVNPQPVPVLTVSIPIGLNFGQSAEPIINQSQAVDDRGLLAGLKIKPQQSFALIGGEIRFQAGRVQLPGGTIELGSVSPNSQVGLQGTNGAWVFDYSNASGFQDITLDNAADVSVFPLADGNIHIQGDNLSILDGSQVLAADAEVLLDINQKIDIAGFSQEFIPGFGIFQIPSKIRNSTLGEVDGKRTIINTKKLIISNSGTIETRSFGLFNPLTGEFAVARGKAGDLLINALESVDFNGEGSGLTSITSSFGDAGTIRINTPKFTARNGARVSVSTLGQFFGNRFPTGAGGRIEINASELVELSGVAAGSGQSSGLFSTSEVGANGAGGEIEVVTNHLSLSDGAVISARTQSDVSGGDIKIYSQDLALRQGGQILTSTFSSGDAGSIKLSISDQIELSGSDPTYVVRFNQFNNPQDALLQLDAISPMSGIFASTSTGSTGNAGNIDIDPRTVIIRDGAGIFVDSNGAGVGGNISLQSGNLFLDGGMISATSTTAQGGNIELQVNTLLSLRNNSLISASAGQLGTGGDGGNVTINADLLVALENSDITANAFTGNGGRVQITTLGIFQSPDSDITASSQAGGIDGVVEINNPEVDPSDSLSELPEVVDPIEQVSTGCRSGQSLGRSSFTHTARGGLPQNPAAALSSKAIWQDLRAQQIQATEQPVSQTTQPTQEASASVPSKWAEAKAWQRLPNGKVKLIAYAVNNNSLPPSASC